MTTIGHALVDSGQLLIIDPCYVWNDDFALSGTPTGLPYDTACRLTLDKGYGEVEGGVVFNTAYGDGRYRIEAETDNNGRVKRITIDFSDDDWDEDDEDEYDEDDEDENICDECGSSPAPHCIGGEEYFCNDCYSEEE